MIKGVMLQNGEYGLRAILTAAWSDEIAAYLLEKDILELELNMGKGWRGTDISFVRSFPRLQSLWILYLPLSSVEPIHSLHELRDLDVSTYCRSEIRFTEFPYLERCALEWRPRATSLFKAVTLKRLFVNGYKAKDVDSFSALMNLEDLQILNAPVTNIYGLNKLVLLKKLRLAGLRCLTSLEGIEELIGLEELQIQTCRRITSIEPLARLKNLRRLFLDTGGSINSLKPIDNLNRLEIVTFAGSTIIVDGDISPLTRQKNLQVAAYKNRRHYSHPRELFVDPLRKSQATPNTTAGDLESP